MSRTTRIFTTLLLMIYLKGDSENTAFDHRRKLLKNLSSLNLNQVNFLLPPRLGQESVDQAMILFNIKATKNTAWPVYSEKLSEDVRALIYKDGSFSTKIVLLSKSAFKSWGVLGSTLAHEIEVHGEQNFEWAFLKNRFFGKTLANLEIDAYNYEIYSKDRFGLSDYDIDELKRLREDYLKIHFDSTYNKLDK